MIALRLSVIVPARNEADVLGPCLESLLAQSEEGFALGEDWELLLVDDGSTDATRSIALALGGVTVLDPDPLQPGWTGKANAVWTSARTVARICGDRPGHAETTVARLRRIAAGQRRRMGFL